MLDKHRVIRILCALGITGILLAWWLWNAAESTRAHVQGELTVCPSGCGYTSIQDAVDAAADGDAIKVVQGIYSGIHQRSGVTQVVYIDVSVTIQGGYASMEDFSNSPDPQLYPTVIDAQDLGRVIYVAEDVTVTLSGLHLTGGNGTDLGGGSGSFPDAGGGIYLNSATTSISDCTIAQNRSPMAGGGYVNRGTFLMHNNVITANTAISGNGGGLFIYAPATSQFHRNTVVSNTAGFNGGGLYIAYGMSDTIFSENTVVYKTKG
jgi:parallel beta-helix repeat protein